MDRVVAGTVAGRAGESRRRNRLIAPRALKFLGPAFVVSVAYMDPGNFATNITAGSRFNYSLLWVLLWSNVFAIFLQCQSAKLGIATGVSLPEHCRRLFSKPVNWVLWAVGVVAAMATDLAEFMGGALGFYLLFRIPVFWAALLTGVVSFLILALDRYGQEMVELAITSLVGVIGVAYVIELFLARPDWSLIAFHTLVPRVDRHSILIATGMLGATVMPHVIYLHSHLVQSRRNATMEAMREHLFMEKLDVLVAMNAAFAINSAMVVVSAATFHSRGIAVDSIELAHETLTPLLGGLSGAAFAVALLASGLSSSAVGTLAGQIIVDGFVGLKMPAWAQRLLTMVPAIVVLSLRADPVTTLVLSQVMLSFVLPAAIVPLLVVTGRADVMGPFVDGKLVRVSGWTIAGLIIALNLALVCSLV
ncbi:MAG: Nramp family divalent metal transporter [Firmicutes bacterium]|jgi:manganese transport protein|nr:Nramp family divalent metal transporter [Bacillota bacterium]